MPDRKLEINYPVSQVRKSNLLPGKRKVSCCDPSGHLTLVVQWLIKDRTTQPSPVISHSFLRVRSTQTSPYTVHSPDDSNYQNDSTGACL